RRSRLAGEDEGRKYQHREKRGPGVPGDHEVEPVAVGWGALPGAVHVARVEEPEEEGEDGDQARERDREGGAAEHGGSDQEHEERSHLVPDPGLGTHGAGSYVCVLDSDHWRSQKQAVTMAGRT